MIILVDKKYRIDEFKMSCVKTIKRDLDLLSIFFRNNNTDQKLIDNIKNARIDKIELSDLEKIVGQKYVNYGVICDSCDNVVGKVVMVGQKPDYDSSTAKLCIDCARKALKMLEDAKKE